MKSIITLLFICFILSGYAQDKKVKRKKNEWVIEKYKTGEVKAKGKETYRLLITTIGGKSCGIGNIAKMVGG